MARAPWAIIKQCLPCWLIESAPYKQAFVFSLIILIPPLLVSPFLLSPLLILLLLTSATVVGALSAWISVKASRMVLKHTIPLHLPLSLSSCLRLLIKDMGVHIFRSFPVINSLPWAWMSHTKTIFASKDSLEDGKSTGSISTSSSNIPSDGRILIGEVELTAFSEVVDDSTTTGDTGMLKKEKLIGSRAEEVATAAEGDEVARCESTEKVSLFDKGEGGAESSPVKAKSRRNIVHFSGGHSDNQPCIMDSSGSGKGTDVKPFTEFIECEAGYQDQSDIDISGNLSPASDYSLKGDGQPRPWSDISLRKPKKNPIADFGASSMKSISGADQSCDLDPRKITGEPRYSQGCNSHSWCQKGINLEEELALLVEDIHSECLESWYPSLSTNKEFPLEFKSLLDLCVKRATFLGEATNISTLSLKLGSLFLCHLREFRKSRRKKRAAEAIAHEATKEEESKPVVAEASDHSVTGEETASGGYGSQQCTPERSDVTTSESKNVVMAVEENSDANFREGSPRSSSTYSRSGPPSSSTKPKTSFEDPLGEEAFYRLRFGPSTRKKNVHGNYLVNLSMLVVKDFVCTVGKLPIDLEVKQYFREFGSSLAESSPGKILVSMISRKVFLPLVDIISDPQWLNARVASLLIDHVGAKVSMSLGEEEEASISYFSSSTSSVVTVRSDQELPVDYQANSTVKVERCEEVCMKNEESSSREERRKSLSLPLEVSSSSITNPIDGRISSVLGGIISTTAGPLLPDNVGISYKPIKRMWSSPSVEEGKELDGEPEYKKKVRHFGRHIVDGLPVYSSALSGRAVLATSHSGVTSDNGQQGNRTSPISKSSHEGAHKQNSSPLSTKKPTKKKFLGLPLNSRQPAEVTSHGGLFRSKSSHDVQASNEGNWHVEEGSELCEGAYLSDDTGSPLDGNKEDRDCFSRKSARSRSFHGMNYSRQREVFRARFSQKQECLKREIKQRGITAGAHQDDDGIILKFESKRERPHAFAPENRLSEENDKVFDDDVVHVGKGLRTRWVKSSAGKMNVGSNMEEDPIQMHASDLSSSHGLAEKGEKINGGNQEKSLSNEYRISDVSKRDEKYRMAQDAGGMVSPNPDSLMELDGMKKVEEFLKSSPMAGEEDGSMKEITKDISPVYEEVEDLPSTVAKLKAFLKERNGSQKSEESASSAEGGKKEFDSLSSLELSLEQDSVQLPKTQSSPLEERPFSWPSDGGIFLNVRIPYTEISKGTTSSQSSNPLLYNSPHVFYCIEYDAAYPEEGADAAVVGLSGEDVEGQPSAGNGSLIHGEDDRRCPENSEGTEAVLPSPGTVINHIVVKRQFQEFVDLHAHLESDPLWREALKGLKGPNRWLNLPFGKASASTVAGRRTLLQAYLRGVCTTMPHLASRSKVLRTFMAYQGTSKALTSGEALPLSVERVLPITGEGGEGPVPRIDKFFARTVSGMFNTLKTALPGFDSQESAQQSSGSHTSASSTPLPSSLVLPSQLDPSSAPAALGEVKTTFGQPGTIKGTMMQLPAFLQFGSSNVATYPDLVDWDMDYSERDTGCFNSGSVEGIPTKTLSLEEDVQAFLEKLENSPTTKEDAEFAFEALDPLDFEDSRDNDDQTVPKGNGRQYLVDSADEDGEEEELDAFLPLCKMAINILCEALRGTGSWVSQGTVVHASKVLVGSLIEEKLQAFLKSVTTKEMWHHYVHILRVVLFNPPPPDLNQPGLKENRNRSISGQQLATAIFTAFPTSFRQVIGNHELLEAAKFIAESLQNKVILRELILQVLHICITHMISSGKRHILEN